MDFLGDILGYIAGICTAICFLPQTICTIRSRNVDGLSLLSYAIYALGMFCWILYGLHITALPMIIFNAPALLFAMIIIYQIIRYKGRLK